jgi:hypothetical protein
MVMVYLHRSHEVIAASVRAKDVAVNVAGLESWQWTSGGTAIPMTGKKHGHCCGKSNRAGV